MTTEGYTAALLITRTEPFTADHPTYEDARAWLIEQTAGLAQSPDFDHHHAGALITDNIDDRTIAEYNAPNLRALLNRLEGSPQE